MPRWQGQRRQSFQSKGGDGWYRIGIYNGGLTEFGIIRNIIVDEEKSGVLSLRRFEHIAAKLTQFSLASGEASAFQGYVPFHHPAVPCPFTSRGFMPLFPKPRKLWQISVAGEGSSGGVPEVDPEN